MNNIEESLIKFFEIESEVREHAGYHQHDNDVVPRHVCWAVFSRWKCDKNHTQHDAGDQIHIPAVEQHIANEKS